MTGSSRIAGRYRDYVMKQPRDFRYGRLTNDAGALRRIAQSLTDPGIDGGDNYFAGIH